MSQPPKTLVVLGVVAMLSSLMVFSTAAGQAGAKPAPALDTDGDAWYDQIEIDLGSSPEDLASVPESVAVPETCFDAIDNDLDGTVDAGDQGCEAPPVFRDGLRTRDGTSSTRHWTWSITSCKHPLVSVLQLHSGSEVRSS